MRQAMEKLDHDGGPWKVLVFLILAVVILAPMWIFANELGPDEFAKSGVGLAAGAVIITALRIIEKKMLK
jgi:hypothetical protein